MKIGVNLGDFNYEVMDSCLAKFGMECTDVAHIRARWNDEDDKATLTCVLRDEIDDVIDDDQNEG